MRKQRKCLDHSGRQEENMTITAEQVACQTLDGNISIVLVSIRVSLHGLYSEPIGVFQNFARHGQATGIVRVLHEAEHLYPVEWQCVVMMVSTALGT